MPLILSDLLLKSSAAIRTNVDSKIKQVATDKIVGLNCSLNPVHIWIGIVVLSSPAKNKTITTSSKDVTKANRAPDITPGNIKGIITLKNVFIVSAPRLWEALIKFVSNPVRVAVTVITTKGVPNAVCANIKPV